MRARGRIGAADTGSQTGGGREHPQGIFSGAYLCLSPSRRAGGSGPPGHYNLKDFPQPPPQALCFNSAADRFLSLRLVEMHGLPYREVVGPARLDAMTTTIKTIVRASNDSDK